jgi:hypothetical protein
MDEFYPFIDQDDEPPGRWVVDPELSGPGTGEEVKTWQGQSGWRTRHGEAVVRWLLGRPHTVWGALLPDGIRGEIHFTLDHGFRRPTTGDRRYIYGDIDIRRDDVVFTDGKQPVYTPPPQTAEPDLEADLARDPPFLNALRQDDRFARAMYWVFRNRTFVESKSGGIWQCGDRQASRLVANLRGMGESYLDYFGRTEFGGVWPDDRPRLETNVLDAIARYSEPVTFDPDIVKVPSRWDTKDGVFEIETEEQAGRLRAYMKREFERNRLESEARRQESLRIFRRQLDNIRGTENDDVYLALRAHLARLGWHTETAAELEEAHRAALAVRVDIVHDVARLEARPEGAMPGWAKKLEPLVRHRQVTLMAIVKGEDDKRTDAERQAEFPEAIKMRIFKLAITGRASNEEYDRLMTRFREAEIHR